MKDIKNIVKGLRVWLGAQFIFSIWIAFILRDEYGVMVVLIPILSLVFPILVHSFAASVTRYLEDNDFSNYPIRKDQNKNKKISTLEDVENHLKN